MTPSREPVMVIGAGLGGLTAALALTRAGWRVRVCEQARVLGEAGAGITLSPGACRGLTALGLDTELIAASLPVPDIAFVHYRTGELLAGTRRPCATDEHRLPTPRHIHRADLHSMLLEALLRIDPQALETGKRLSVVERDGGRLVAGFADGSAHESALLVGADGTRSTVRRSLFDDPPPTFAGQIAFRCLIPREAAAPFMPGGTAAVYVGASRIFNRYPIRGGTLVNVVGIARTELWQEEGWQTPATIGEFVHEFRGFHPDVVSLIERAPPQSLIKWGLFVRPPIRDWSAGGAVLLGDAAHPILPFLGLGAALAIEDGIVLARALAAAADLHGACAAFQRARAERVEEVRLQSIEQGQIIQAADPDRTSLRRAPSQNAELFDYDPCTAAINF
jgi:salicylate hydroxylase